MDDDEDDGGRDIPISVEVWACNMPTVAAFRLCRLAGVGCMSGVYWTGIPISDAQAACVLLQVPPDEMLSVVADLLRMGDAVATARNERAAAALQRK